MKRKILIPLAILVVIIAAIAIYFTQKPKEPETIKIGAILPLTGNWSIVGEPQRNSIILAFGDTGLSEKRIKIFIEDSKGDPKEGVNIVSRLINVENVDIFLVTGDNIVRSVKDIIISKGKILFPLTATPDITDGKNIFRIFPNSRDEMRLLAEFANKNSESVAIIYPNIEMGLISLKIFKEYFKKNIVAEESFNINVKNFRDVILKVKNKITKNTLIVFQGLPGDIVPFIKQLRENNIKNKILTSMATTWPSTLKALSEMGESPIFVSPRCILSENYISYKTLEFRKKFINKFKIEPNWDVYFVYDLVGLLNESASRGVLRNRKMFKDYWQMIHKITGVSGDIFLLDNGDSKVDLFVSTIINGKIVPLTNNK
jgi:ABC-type branched-subunit amino acid transport system substrate-binding protein